jgi:hypothetical protein
MAELLESERWSFTGKSWQPTSENSLLTNDPARWSTGGGSGQKSAPPSKLWLRMPFDSPTPAGVRRGSLLDAARWAPLHTGEGECDADGWRYAFDFKALAAAGGECGGAGGAMLQRMRAASISAAAGSTDCVRQRRWRPLGHLALVEIRDNESAGAPAASGAGAGAGTTTTLLRGLGGGEALGYEAFLDLLPLGAPWPLRQPRVLALGAVGSTAEATACVRLLEARWGAGTFMGWNLSGRPSGLRRAAGAAAEENAAGAGAALPWLVEPRSRGSAVLPLQMVCSVCAQIDAWLDADPTHVAVVHCTAGCRRSNLLLACLAAWQGGMQQRAAAAKGSSSSSSISSTTAAAAATAAAYAFESGADALGYIAAMRRGARLLPLGAAPSAAECGRRRSSASERRYAGYAHRLLADGAVPSSAPLLLRRVIVHTVPEIAWRNVNVRRGGAAAAAQAAGLQQAAAARAEGGGRRERGCRPVLQVFSKGKLVFSTSWAGVAADESEPGVRWVGEDEGGIVFQVDSLVAGDCTIRCAHVRATWNFPAAHCDEWEAAQGARSAGGAGAVAGAAASAGKSGETMFLASFHAGYVGTTTSERGDDGSATTSRASDGCGGGGGGGGGEILHFERDELDGILPRDTRYDSKFWLELVFAPVTLAEAPAVDIEDADEAVGGAAAAVGARGTADGATAGAEEEDDRGASAALVCGNCEDGRAAAATHHCTECAEYLCAECHSAHRLLKMTRGHRMRPLTAAEAARGAAPPPAAVAAALPPTEAGVSISTGDTPALQRMLEREASAWSGILQRRAQLRSRRQRRTADAARGALGIGLDEEDVDGGGLLPASPTATTGSSADVRGTQALEDDFQEQLLQMTFSAPLGGLGKDDWIEGRSCSAGGGRQEPGGGGDALEHWYDLDEGGAAAAAVPPPTPPGRGPASAASADIAAISRDLESELEQMRELERELGLDPLSAELGKDSFGMMGEDETGPTVEGGAADLDIADLDLDECLAEDLLT